jgi:putative ATP-dependent endonuclease of OLD family
MYLYTLKLWNWRKFGSKLNGDPGLEIVFNKNLNVLVGENDSGKTAIIDAIKTILGTNSNDSFWLSEDDFNNSASNAKIECTFKSLSKSEEGFFYEWLSFKEDNTTELRIILEMDLYVDLNGQKKLRKSIKAGDEGLETPMDDEARQLLTITYLKPLRDAEVELNAGRKSRIAQIIRNMKEISLGSNPLYEEIVIDFENAFNNLKGILREPVLNKIKTTIDEFFNELDRKSPEIRNKDMSFVEILRRLELNIGEVSSGLGSSNLLFIAAELLLLSEGDIGPKMAIIEEVEAHIHPQAQLRLIKYFEEKSKEKGIQYILSTHSTTLASSIKLQHQILIYNSEAYPLGEGFTLLNRDDYSYLERFLDATKANMFFAQGIIFVEGDAENLLIPTVAEIIGRPLHKYGVSIVNVGSLAFKRYSTIFLRENEMKPLNLPISIISDLDLKPRSFYKIPSYFEITCHQTDELKTLFGCDEDLGTEYHKVYIEFEDLYEELVEKFGKEKTHLYRSAIIDLIRPVSGLVYDFTVNQRTGAKNTNLFNNREQTKVFLSTPWTLEYALAKSCFSRGFQEVVLHSHYKVSGYITKQLAKWAEITDPEELAVDIYKFILEKDVSKSIISQNFANYLWSNKDIIRKMITIDDDLKYLVEAILHVTGGISNWSLSLQNT